MGDVFGTEMANRILIPTSRPEDWQSLLGDPQKHWKPGFSAMATAYAWEAARGLPREIAALFSDDHELLFAIPEHKVPIPGLGSDSQCDVFALLRADRGHLAMAVEAKVSEPFGDTVSDWLSKGGANRLARVEGICALLDVDYPVEASLRYQLFHRTAAAVVEAKRFGVPRAAMIVQTFSEKNAWLEDFLAFTELFGSDGKSTFTTKVLSSGIELSLGWASCRLPQKAVLPRA